MYYLLDPELDPRLSAKTGGGFVSVYFFTKNLMSFLQMKIAYTVKFEPITVKLIKLWSRKTTFGLFKFLL